MSDEQRRAVLYEVRLLCGVLVALPCAWLFMLFAFYVDHYAGRLAAWLGLIPYCADDMWAMVCSGPWWQP